MYIFTYVVTEGVEKEKLQGKQKVYTNWVD